MRELEANRLGAKCHLSLSTFAFDPDYFRAVKSAQAFGAKPFFVEGDTIVVLSNKVNKSTRKWYFDDHAKALTWAGHLAGEHNAEVHEMPNGVVVVEREAAF